MGKQKISWKLVYRRRQNKMGFLNSRAACLFGSEQEFLTPLIVVDSATKGILLHYSHITEHLCNVSYSCCFLRQIAVNIKLSYCKSSTMFQKKIDH